MSDDRAIDVALVASGMELGADVLAHVEQVVVDEDLHLDGRYTGAAGGAAHLSFEVPGAGRPFERVHVVGGDLLRRPQADQAGQVGAAGRDPQAITPNTTLEKIRATASGTSSRSRRCSGTRP